MSDQRTIVNSLVEGAENHPIQIYFNMFINNIGVSDISTVLIRNTAIVGVLHMSMTTAKTYAQILGAAVEQFEAATGQQISIAPDIADKMLAGQASSSNPTAAANTSEP